MFLAHWLVLAMSMFSLIYSIPSSYWTDCNTHDSSCCYQLCRWVRRDDFRKEVNISCTPTFSKCQTLRADRRAVNVFYISIIPLIDSSLQADSIEVNFVFWSNYQYWVVITCCSSKSGRMTLDRSFSIDKKVDIR